MIASFEKINKNLIHKESNKRNVIFLADAFSFVMQVFTSRAEPFTFDVLLLRLDGEARSFYVEPFCFGGQAFCCSTEGFSFVEELFGCGSGVLGCSSVGLILVFEIKRPENIALGFVFKV